MDPLIKAEIKKLSKAELEKLVLKAAVKDKSFLDYLLVNYLDKKEGEKVLFYKAKDDIDILIRKRYNSYAEEEKLGHMLAACYKRTNEFGKICKQKKLELDLIMYVLDIPFSHTPKLFGTCFSNFDYRVVLLLKKAIALWKDKIHEDDRIEYEEKLNTYLQTLHRHSNNNDFVFILPETI